MASIWHETVTAPAFPSLKGNIKTDVIIIGGGIAGILTSYMLKEKGIKSVILESSRICGGTTGNTTAKITPQHSLIYSKLFRKSPEIAEKYYDINRMALDKYKELSAVIDCDFEIKDNYIYSTLDRRKIEEEAAVLEKIGAKPLFREELPLPFRINAAVGMENQAQFHPLKFAYRLAKGAEIYENSPVINMLPQKAVTPEGTAEAQHIIIATHFPINNKHGLYPLKLYQHRSYVIAIENGADINGMYLDEKEGGLSFRNYKDLLFVGGGDHRTGKKGGSYRELISKIKSFYPESQEKYRWAAQDCMSLDSMPYIGNYSAKTQNFYVATGFNKWGMTGAMSSAMILSDMISGKENIYASLFSPSRNMITPQLFMNILESAAGLLCPLPKRCPHLGCVLKYNSAEHSWDCPCHGSRFSQEGKLLEGPANGDIK